jgi:UPF0271 protein
VRTIDLNADVGEGHDDLPIFPFVSSVSVACGSHAGDDETMERSVAEAARLGVVVGAHPSYPDREGYGRRRIAISDDDLRASLGEQLAALSGVVSRHGVRLAHVKPHGALYNEAAGDEALSALILEAIKRHDPSLAVVALAGSTLISVAVRSGVRAIAEGFADRRYLADGRLAPREVDGALIVEPAAAAEQAARLAIGEPVESLDGSDVRVGVETICLHADTPDAARIAGAVRGELERRGIRIAPASA